jgi:mono/diheme cytochrome c family protein
MRRAIVAAAIVVLAGCAGLSTDKPPIQVFSDMKRQPKYKPQESSGFFTDGRTDRSPVSGTVAVGRLNEDEGFHTGAAGGRYVGRNPLPITAATLARGQERYNIYCAPCHDRTGSGRGLVGQKSMWLANSLHDPRIKSMVDGEIYQVISLGRRSMPGYRFQIAAGDRWAIVAYVRALQRATSGTIEDVPADLRSELR